MLKQGTSKLKNMLLSLARQSCGSFCCREVKLNENEVTAKPLNVILNFQLLLITTFK